MLRKPLLQLSRTAGVVALALAPTLSITSPALAAKTKTAEPAAERVLIGAHWTTRAGADTLLALTNPKGFTGVLRLASTPTTESRSRKKSLTTARSTS